MSIKTLEKIRPVVTEKKQFASREDSKVIARSEIKPRIKLTNLSIESSCTSVGILIQTLMEGIKPVVTNKYEFECRDKPIRMAFFESFGLSGFRCVS